MKKTPKIFLFLFLLLAYKGTFAYFSPGTPSGFVTDFANVISEETQVSLENQLTNFSASTTIEIAVVTVNSLEGDSVENYANELFREWGIGKKEYNNGVLFLVSPNDRKARIEVGYGLEGIMPDIQAGYIMDNIIIPQFKNGNYEQGIIEGINSIQLVVQGEKFDIPKQNLSQDIFEDLVVFGIIFGLFILQGIVALLASTKSWWLGGVFGVGAGLGISYLLGVPGFDWVLPVILGISGLFFDYVISKSYKKYKSKGGRKGPLAWGFSRGSGGGGGGGFGGGSSGGGGASGSW